MRKIHKHSFEMNGGTHLVTLPDGFEIKHVACQNGMTTMWYEFDTATTTYVPTSFAIFPTGGEIPDGWLYVGTAVCPVFVWHLYVAD